MNRREFTGLIGAGALFPADFLKAVGADSSRNGSTVGVASRGCISTERIPRLSGTQWGTHWWCLGNEENPVLVDEIAAVHACLTGRREWTPELNAIPRIGYHITLPPNRWVIVLGNEARPAFHADVQQCVAEMRYHLKIGCQLPKGIRYPGLDEIRHLNIVTHHVAVPYFIPGRRTDSFEFFGLHNATITTYSENLKTRIAEGLLRRFPPKWSNSPTHEEVW